jgi:hypothetical protein
MLAFRFNQSEESETTRLPLRRVMRRSGCSPCAALKIARASRMVAARASTRSISLPASARHGEGGRLRDRLRHHDNAGTRH